MDYETMSGKIADIDLAIIGRIDAEAELLKNEYTDDMRDTYENDDSDDYESFDDYLESEADDYLNFAFGYWIETLIRQLIGCTEADLKALASGEREQLTVKYFDHFKRLSDLGEVSEDL